MAYTTDAATFAQQIAGARAVAGSRSVWAGIGAWRLSPAQTLEHIALARKAGAAGLVLFSYDSLTGPSQSRSDYLDEIARAAFQLSGATAAGGAR
jgi:dihydrodipicolinate synthase/N-acetylneuraminate lyase